METDTLPHYLSSVSSEVLEVRLNLLSFLISSLLPASPPLPVTLLSFTFSLGTFLSSAVPPPPPSSHPSPLTLGRFNDTFSGLQWGKRRGGEGETVFGGVSVYLTLELYGISSPAQHNG